MIVLNATRERMARGNDQRTGEIVLVAPSDLSPGLIERQRLSPNLVSVVQIRFPFFVISEIQANKGTTTNQRKKASDDFRGLLLCHGKRIRGHWSA